MLLKDYPSFGDIKLIVNNKVKFVGLDATPAELEETANVGVVYNVQGKHYDVVGGDNETTKQWSAVADYEITAIPSISQDCAVAVGSGATAWTGTFSYTRNLGTIEEFVTQLNTWLALQTGTEIAKWEAYMYNDKGYFQKSTYDSFEGTVSIGGCTLVKQVGSELAAMTNASCLNQIKQSIFYCGMCRDRMDGYCRANTTTYCNPTSRMDGVTQLYTTYPVSKTYYDGTLGDGLRANFASYDDYLDACMARLYELNKGTMQFRDGELMTNLLKDKKVLRWGEEIYAYPYARHAVEFDSGVSGYGAGTWHGLGMHELGLLMRHLKVDYSDPINTQLAKVSGWSKINPAANRWSVARYTTNTGWYYAYFGMLGASNFYNRVLCSVGSAFSL